MKKFLLVVIAFASSSAMAAGYKSAGCGLGSMVIQEEGFMQVLAATTNGTSASQTFGITSGTSNCAGAGGVSKAAVKQEVYVSSNFDSLSQEMAQGNGEHIAALANVMGCEKSVTPHFGKVLKANYKNMNTTSPEALLETVKNQVSADATLAKSCSI